MNKTPNSSPSAIAATVASGIRSVFAYSPTLRIATWKPSLTLDDSVLPEWVLNQVQELATLAPFGDGRVQFGLGFDGYFLPKEDVVNLFNRCRQAGTKLITSHYTRNIILGTDSIIELLDSYGLLGPDVIISHSTNLTAADVAKLNKTGASIACAPEVEIQMAFGNPVCFQKEIKHLCSLGIDSHSINSASLISQMRICLQAERGRRNTLLSNRNKVMKTLNTSVHDVFRLGTIQGARAMNMQDEIGSLADGKLADIVIFDAHSPAMICAVEEDPVAAIVLHSSVRDIDTVIIDGVIRKRAGRLLPVTVVGEFMDLSLDLGGTPRHMEWSEIAAELLKSKERINERAVQNGAVDSPQLLEETIDIFQVPRELII
ncbi:hypothetical protein MAP00_000888 [Monascus purpureus]|nr:hypothetical protein MAP00_000888 [Monascus purpureus]